MRVGIYMDLTPRQFVRSLPGVEDLWCGNGGPLTHVRVMVDRPDGRPRVTPEDFEGIVETMAERQAVVSPVFWPRKSWSATAWARAARIAGIASGPIGLDIEHQAKRKSTRQAIYHTAGIVLGSRDLVITTHPWHPEAKEPTWDPDVVRYEVQSYSTASSFADAGRMALPGNWQARCADLPCRPRELALALYGQAELWGLPRTNLDLAFSAASTRVDTVTYWSYKHLLRNKYALPFLRQVGS